MKKLFAIVLCLAMLVSAVAISASAAGEKSLAEVFAQYGLKPTYAPETTAEAPVADGVVEEGEYTYVREFTNLSDSYVDKTFEDYSENYNFGANCHPNNGVVIKEYVAHDAENIYIAFEFGQDLKDFMFRFNPAQDTIYDCASSCHTMELSYAIPEGVDRDDVADFRWKDATNVAGEAEFRFLNDGDNLATVEQEDDEYDGVVQRNFESDEETFKNITAEFRFSKAGILNATVADDDEVEIFSYYCKGKRVEAGAGVAEGGDVTLQWTPPFSAVLDKHPEFMSAEEWMAEFYPTASVEKMAEKYQMFRFICLYEDDNYYDPNATDAPTTDEPTDDTPATDAPSTNAPATDAPATDATTAAATTAAAEGGCGKSIALSALAIVPVLGLGVAVVSKKKED